MTIDPNDATARLAGVTDGTPFLDLTNQHGTHRWYYVRRAQWYNGDLGYCGTKALGMFYQRDRAQIEEIGR